MYVGEVLKRERLLGGVGGWVGVRLLRGAQQSFDPKKDGRKGSLVLCVPAWVLKKLECFHIGQVSLVEVELFEDCLGLS